MIDNILSMVRILVPACILCLCVAGCQDRQQNKKDTGDLTTQQEFYIGLLPEQNIFQQKERYGPLAGYLSQQLGIKAELRIAGSYSDLLEKLQAGALDAAFLGSFPGAVALKKLEAQPLARMQYADGSSTYRGLIFTRKDSGIVTAQDMKGKTFVFVDKMTTAGWLFPLNFFKENNIDDPFSWLGETYFAGTHEDAILDVVNNKVLPPVNNGPI